MQTTSSAPASPVAVAEHLARLHKSGRGVEDATLEIRPGEILAVLGTPGSGRSTLLRLLATQIEPASGGLSLWGHATGRARRRQRARIGFQPAVDAHFPALSGFQNAYFFGSLYRVPRERLIPRVDGMFDELELRVPRDQPVGAWDADERRRLSIAEAMLHTPELLLLDQPFEGLAYASSTCVRNAVLRAAARGTAVVLTGALEDPIAASCARVALMHRGRVLTVVTPAAWAAGGGATGELLASLGGEVA